MAYYRGHSPSSRENHFFGEYFVVYSELGEFLAIGKRVYAKAENCDDRRLHMRSLKLNLAEYFENRAFKIEKGNLKETKTKFRPIKLVFEKV